MQTDMKELFKVIFKAWINITRGEWNLKSRNNKEMFYSAHAYWSLLLILNS